MSLLSRAQIKQFIAENQLKTAEDVQEALKAVFSETLQAMLDGAFGLPQICHSAQTDAQ